MNISRSLLSIPLLELTRRVLKGGRVSPKGTVILFVYYSRLIIAMPFALVQLVFYSKKIRSTPISHNPVFILGHFRSGTTLLQKLMISDRRFGYISNFDMMFPSSFLLLGTGFQWLLQ